MAKTICTFLGANTPKGFVSFFDELYNPYSENRAYIIKGGPGTGKSTLMKKVGKAAEKKGLDVEYVFCSSDPKSLDGIIIPQKGLCFADGTSPHTVEPKFPGVCENIINTGDFWDKDALFKKGDEIRTLTLENSLHHRCSSRYLAAAGKLSEENMRTMAPYVNTEKIFSYVNRFVKRELPQIKKEPGRKSRRFISAVTPFGKIFADSTVTSLCSRVIAVEDEYSAVSPLLIDSVGELAVKRGYDVIFCYCPMKPFGECEHIIIPEANLALVSHKSTHASSLLYDRVIHSRRFLSEGAEKNKKRLVFNKKLQHELFMQSISCLKNAKETHDRLEKIYAENMDYNLLGEYTQKIISETVDV